MTAQVSPPDIPVLEQTLRTPFAPGTNRRGRAIGGAWTLLLDDLDLDAVACLGLPRERTLRTLALRARAVEVICTDRLLDDVRREIERFGIGGVAAVPVAGARDLGPVDLAVVTSARWARRAATDRCLRVLIRDAGAVYTEGGAALRLMRTAPLRPANSLWVGVARGEVELAAGWGDAAAVDFLRRPPAASYGAGRRPRAVARRVRERARIRPRRAVLSSTRPARVGTGAAVPGYVHAIAAAAGTPLDDCRAALVAPADFPSRKALLVLFRGDASRPAFVVKLTRDPAFNDRLENEARALRALAARAIGDDETLPRAAFFGHHAGLAILGETAIAGVPFRQATTATPDRPLAPRAAEWLLDLGARTADHRIAGSADVATALHRLLARFVEVYRPDPGDRRLLEAEVEAVARSTSPFPVVFQHGDPGTWNLLITPSARPAFLDWEAAEPHGMPLWDLFYFARSVGVTASRAAGGRSALDAFAEHYLADAPLSRWLASTVEAHCVQIGLDRALVEPLFLTCWMHRAVKEAATLEPARVESGRYAALLRLCSARREAPGLRRLFDGGS